MNKEVLAIPKHDTQLAPVIPVFESPYIKAIHDQSDDFSDIEKTMREIGLGLDMNMLSMARLLIEFHNDYKLSIIRGEMSFGGSHGLFEIAVFHPDKGMTGEYFEGRDRGAEVLGHCKIEDVQYFIEKIGKLPTTKNAPIETKLLANQK